jgi:CO dehydrogenase nickel-insertion accessory protein CooC1
MGLGGNLMAVCVDRARLSVRGLRAAGRLSKLASALPVHVIFQVVEQTRLSDEQDLDTNTNDGVFDVCDAAIVGDRAGVAGSLGYSDARMVYRWVNP